MSLFIARLCYLGGLLFLLTLPISAVAVQYDYNSTVYDSLSEAEADMRNGDAAHRNLEIDLDNSNKTTLRYKVAPVPASQGKGWIGRTPYIFGEKDKRYFRFYSDAEDWLKAIDDTHNIW